jgi:predicted nucleic acid-binding protein
LTVFVDAGGWLSVLVPNDRYHRAGARHYRALIAAKASFVTTDFVLDEVITRLRYDVGHTAATDFIALFHAAEDAGTLAIHRITPDLWQEAEQIFLQFRQSKLSFTDCTSFALLRRHPVDEVFSYDAHFEMMGHILKPKP